MKFTTKTRIAAGLAGLALVVFLAAAAYRGYELTRELNRSGLAERGMVDAILLFELANRRLPDPESWIQELVAWDSDLEYLVDRARRDRWGNPYRYEVLDNGSFRLVSLGADGKLGTSDDVDVVAKVNAK